MSAAETPAALLRRAAEYLRALAGGATSGPWRFDGNPSGVVTAGAYARSVASAYNRGPGANPVNAAWIAMMHPGVGVALAGWLEQAADAFEGVPVADGEPALRVARAVLGEVAS